MIEMIGIITKTRCNSDMLQQKPRQNRGLDNLLTDSFE
jgi:hypothetical protein